MPDVQQISILTAAGTDGAPSAAPSGVAQEKLIFIPERIAKTDQQPLSLWLGLLGTAGNTVVVTLWWSPDDPQTVPPGSRRWLSIHSGVTVTVGAVTRIAAVPGLCAIQVTTTSAANSTLLAKVSTLPVTP